MSICRQSKQAPSPWLVKPEKQISGFIKPNSSSFSFQSSYTNFHHSMSSVSKYLYLSSTLSLTSSGNSSTLYATSSVSSSVALSRTSSSTITIAPPLLHQDVLIVRRPLDIGTGVYQRF